jgi:hypothetical protein
LEVALFGAGIGLAVELESGLGGKGAGFEYFLGVLEYFRESGKGLMDLWDGFGVFIGLGEFDLIEFSDQGIGIDGSEEFMDAVSFVMEEGDGLPDHEAVGVLLVEGKGELVDLARADTEELVGSEKV